MLQVAQVFLFMIAGYLAVRFVPVLQRGVPYLLKITLNILLPLYFIHNLSSGWGEAVTSGWYWMVIFFCAALAMMAIQFFLGKAVVALSRPRLEHSGRELLLLSALHNAGYIPLPILAVLVPGTLLVYMFFYFLAFNLVFWTAASFVLSRRQQGGFQASKLVNGPLIGLAAGIVMALSGAYQYIPAPIEKFLESGTDYILPVLLVLVGAIIAQIPMKDLTYRREYTWLIVILMIVYPAVVLAVVLFIPAFNDNADLDFALRLALVVEAAVPPATNNLLAAKAFGSKKQVQIIGGAIVYTYLAACVTLPLFIVLTLTLFR